MNKFAALILVGLACATVGMVRDWLDWDVISGATQRGDETKNYVELVQSVLRDVTKGTEFEGNWQVNNSAVGRGLSVYLFRGGAETPAALRPYKRNCGFTGHRAVVVCDVEIIEYLAKRWGVDQFIEDGEHQKVVTRQPCTDIDGCRFIVAWLLSHEMGHIFSKHGASHFASSLDDYVNDSTVAERKELEADAFVVDRFGPPALDGRDPYFELIAALNSEISISLCPNTPRHCEAIAYGAGLTLPASYEKHPILFSVGGSHPDFVVRTIRLLRLAEERYKKRFFGGLIESVYQQAFRPRDFEEPRAEYSGGQVDSN